MTHELGKLMLICDEAREVDNDNIHGLLVLKYTLQPGDHVKMLCFVFFLNIIQVDRESSQKEQTLLVRQCSFNKLN